VNGSRGTGVTGSSVIRKAVIPAAGLGTRLLSVTKEQPKEMLPVFARKVDPLGPRSCYEEGKRFGEALCKEYRDEYGIDVRLRSIWICLGIFGFRGRAFG